MDRWFKGLITAACVAIIAAVGYYFWGEYEDARERAEQIAILQQRKEEEALRQRVAELAPRCNDLVDRLLTLNEEKPIKSTADIPVLIRDDLVLCAQKVPLTAYNEHGLEYTGLAKLLR